MADPNYRYRIQIRQRGRYWETKWALRNAAQADLMYAGLNIGNGYSKRLLKDGRVVAEEIS